MSEILIKLKVDTENLKNEMKEAEGLAENFGKKIEDKLVVTPKIELKNLKEFRESIKEAAGDASKLTAIRDAMIEASKSIDATDKNFAKLQKSIKDVDKQIEDLKKNPPIIEPEIKIKNLDELKKALKQIGAASGEVWDSDKFNAEINKAVNDAKKLGEIRNELLRVAEGVDKASDEFKFLQATIAGVDKQIESLGQESTKTASEIRTQMGSAFSSLSEGFSLFKSGDLLGSFNAIRGGIQGITSASLSFIATPIGAAIAALAGIGLIAKEWFDFNMEVSKLNGEIEQLTGSSGLAADEFRKTSKAISETFGKDFSDAVVEQDRLIKNFGLSAEEAFDVYTKGLARGGARNEEFGDSIKEYAVFFKKAGFSADEFLNILNTGVDLGVYSDKLPDAIKEFGLRISEGTKPAEDALKNAFGEKFTNDLLGGVKNGTISVKDSLSLVAKEAEKAGLKTGQLAELTAALGGGPSEDLGGIENLFKAINQAQELAKKGLTEYEQAMINSAQRAKDLEDAKERAFKSDTAIAFAKTVKNLWTDIQIGFFNAIAELRPVFEFLFNSLQTGFQTIKTIWGATIDFLTGDFKGAVDTIKGYFTSLNFIWDGVIDKMKIKISEGLLYIAKKVKPVFDALGINTDNIIKSLENSITRSTNNITKIQKQKAAELAVAKAEAKKEEQAQQKQTPARSGGGSKSTSTKSTGTKTDNKAIIEAEKKYNEAILKEKLEAEKVLAKELENARAEYRKKESLGTDSLILEQEKLKLLAIEEKYLNDLLVLQSQTAGKLKDGKDKEGNSLTQDREKELELARKTNDQLIKLNEDYNNADLKLKLDKIKANEDLNTQQLEDDFKNVKLKDNANKLEKAQFEKLQNEKLQIINQSKIKFAEAQRDAIADVLKGAGIDPSTNAAFNELNKKINELRKNGAKLAEEGVIANVRVQFTQEEQDKEKIKKTINELADFAQQGLLMQIGLDPASVSAFRSQIDNVFEVFNNKASSSEEKFRAVAEVAATSMKIASDLMFNAEAQRIEEERALNAENEAIELENAEGNEQQKALIKQKYDEKERQLKRRAAENEKRKVLTEIKINTALAIVKAAASLPFPANIPAIALATALGVAQYAIAASQPIPKFKDGVVGFNGIVGGVGSGKSDSNLAFLSRGESVIPAEATSAHKGLITDLVTKGSPDDYISQHYILPAIKNLESENKRETEKRMSEMQNLIITSTISQTLKSIDRKQDVNTEKIVTAVKHTNKNFNL
jgi:hypothetical protein